MIEDFGLELIVSPESVEGSEGLLAIVIRGEWLPELGTRFFTQPKHGLQLGSIHRTAGCIIPAHTHVGAHRQTQGTQEVLILRSGWIKVTFYTSSGEMVTSRELVGGDVVMLVSGGHRVEFIEESDILEVKQGPYPGPQDKVNLEVK